MFKYKIEEILEALKPHDKEFAKADIKEYSLVLSVEEQKILLDYINNLQKENNKYKIVLDKIKEEIEQLGIVDCNIPNYIICISKISELLEEIE